MPQNDQSSDGKHRACSLSFIVPAHDEAELIGATVGAIQAAAAAAEVDYEIIVVDDASSDATAAIAAAGGARVVRSEARHIAAARNVGAAAARGETFVFVDADTVIDADVVRAVEAAMREGAIGGGAAVRFDEPVPRWARVLLPPFLWCYRRLRLAAGCFLFCSRAAFTAVGGFDERLFAAEEVAMSRALQRLGRFVILREAVVTSARKLRTHSGREILGVFGAIAVRGKCGVRDRRRLGLWYGPRRRDPSTVR